MFSIFLGTTIGAVVGTLVWGIFFWLIGSLISITGGITFQPFGAVSTPGLGILGLKLGLIAGAVHGLLTGLVIGIYQPFAIKGGAFGLLVTQAAILALLSYIYIRGSVLNPIVKGMDNIFDLIDLIFYWIFLTVFFFVVSAVTGCLTAKVLNLAASRTSTSN